MRMAGYAETINKLADRSLPLLERLRLLQSNTPARAIMHEAADHIEKLEAEIERMSRAYNGCRAPTSARAKEAEDRTMTDKKDPGKNVSVPGRPRHEVKPDPNPRPPPGSKPTPVPDPPKKDK